VALINRCSSIRAHELNERPRRAFPCGCLYPGDRYSESIKLFFGGNVM